MNKLQKILATGAITLPLIFGGCGRINSGSAKASAPTPTQQVQEEGRKNYGKTILSYLAQPDFSSNDLMKQVTGVDANLEVYNFNEGAAYFIIKAENYDENTIKRVGENPNSIEFGRTEDGKYDGGIIRLGLMKFRMPKGEYVFRVPANELRVDPSTILKYKYPSATYTLSMPELQAFVENKNICGGYLRFLTGERKNGRNVTFSNHGAFVAKKGEKSLERLVEDLTRGAQTKEEQIQKLLDFVTLEIKYNQEEASGKVETLKRPNEVLMTGNSDCSGKTILLASLVNQLDVKSWLLYMPNHITVAVEGNFPNNNNTQFNIGGEKVTVAESVAKGYIIGRSKINIPFRIENVQQIQPIGENSEIFDAKTEKQLKHK